MSLRRSLAVPLILWPTVALSADSPPGKTPLPKPDVTVSIEQQLRQNPDDSALWNRYLRNSFWPLMTLVNSNPDQAQKRVDAMRQVVNSLQPTQDEAKKMLARAKWTLGFWEQRIELARTPRAALEAKLKSKPDDGPTISLYAQKVRTEILPLIYLPTDRAERNLKAARTFLDDLKPRVKEESAKKAWKGADQTLTGLQHSIDAARQAAQLARLPQRELEAKLKANPDDGQSITVYGQKLWMELGPLIAGDADRAEQGLNSAKTFLDVLRPKVKDQAARKSLEGVDQGLSRLRAWIDRAKQRAALVGKDAAPLEVAAWVNGTPLTAADLKGKVVLLDFWAVWFGPSIAAFPHLREWHEKYADKGLVIIGLTRYFDYVWDEKASRPIRAQGQTGFFGRANGNKTASRPTQTQDEEKVAPKKEREMLAKFAEYHKLPYRIAIQKDKSLGEYYAVDHIPHVVLIDREGKIRLIREGGGYQGEKNMRDIQEMIEKLIASRD